MKYHTILQNARIFIAGCARDCQSTIRPILKKLQKLGCLCKEYRICIVENDSVDATRTILEQAQAVDSNILLPDLSQYIKERNKHIDMNPSHSTQYNIDNYHDSSLQKNHMQERVLRIALARDCYLHSLSTSSFKADYVLMLDLDLVNFSIHGIVRAITLLSTWDVITAMGLSVSRQSSFMPIYYDSYALDMQDYPNKGFDWQISLQSIVTKKLKAMKHVPLQQQVLPVLSAFAGLAVYKAYLLDNSSYVESCKNDSFVYCEHVSLHKELYKRHKANIAIYAGMKVYVSHYISMAQQYIKKIIKTVIGDNT